MSIIVRLALFVALVAGGFAVYKIQFTLGPNIEKIRDNERTATAEVEKSKKALAKAQAEVKTHADEVAKAHADLQAANQQVTEAKASATALQGQLKDATDKLAAVDKMPATSQTQLTELQAKVTAAEQARDAATAKAKDAEDKVKQTVDKIAAIEGEKKLLVDNAKQLDSKLKFMEGKEGWEVKLPDGLTGKVIYYDKTWNFVVLDVGKKKGAEVNGVMTLHRGTEVLGKVRITTVDDDACIADFMGDFKKHEPKPGDRAIY